MEFLVVIIFVAAIAYFALKLRLPTKQKISRDHLPDVFVVIDLETTGLDASKHEIIEIAAIRYRKDGGKEHETYQSLVRPKKKVPKKITEITGITQEMIERDGQELHKALAEFNEFIGTHRLVTFNAEFDMAFLTSAWKKCDHAVPRNQVSCALKMARRAWPGRKTYRLSDLASAT
ncbi:PolC-type DNA polymerase III [Piscinibacter sp. HJYY11]|uniref:3'-5' exonuclease n=1 Tax=Piscinibacter sp. HJYY11 TaxID=2801333 RepID=UPI00191EA9B2|nr:3'-5' exonuclease [Piscinibacter sp. HJYY11]MBL0729663.1 3'-5' exonuclease [Piscinibacter sp. HJYY11]